jgi:replicative DNA helicase
LTATPIQQQVMRKALLNPIFSKEILPRVPLAVFDDNDVYKELTNIIKRYYQTNGDVMSEDALLTLTQDKLDRMRKDADTQQEYFNAIHELYNVRDSQDNTVIDEQIEKYIKKHMRMELLKEMATNLDNEAVMDKMDEKLREIMLLDVSGKRQEIINVIDDVEAKRQALSTLHTNTIPTGFASINHLNGGGLAKGELGMVVAASGTGKTLILTNLATNYTRLRYNVLFIALEELENRMILKFEQSMLQRNKSDILTGSTLNEKNFNAYQNVYKNNRDKFGNLFFARYSPRTITPAKIEQLIADVQLRHNKQIDVVLIDYPELLRNPNATGNEAEDGGKLFEEMRRIGQEYNVVMWTAAQMNRTAYSAVIRTSEHMEGALRKKNAAELILTVNQTPEEYNAGFIRLYADKVRNPPEGPFDRMIGLKVVGSAQTVRDYKTEHEKKEHIAVLEEVDSKMDQQFKGKRKSKDDQPAINYADMINNTIQASRQGAQTGA